MTLEILEMPYELVYVNPCEEETMTQEFLKLSPQRSIPVFKDGDLILNESRAVMAYLANKHGNTKLYPEDIKTRARIDQRLYFEMGSYSASGAAVAVSTVEN